MNMRKIALLAAALGLLVAACGGSSTSDTTAPPAATGPGDPVNGAAVYQSSCASCHGGDLAGIDGLGKVLAPSEFVTSMTEEELAAFIAVGRAADAPENMQGVAMPARGGNPSLTDQDLRDVSAYLKAQQ
ncbi:MAG: cytochrome c [Acidimicrobiia bacterium]|nr:cytochrome c [Acidimicrobiia bacterium]